MRIIVLNGKKLGLAIVMVGLMMVLIGFGKHFEDKLKFATLAQSNMNNLKEYKISNSKIYYKLPDKWIANLKEFSGGEVLYHNDFKSEDSAIHGFVQTWNTGGSLKEFLDNSKEVSEKQNKIEGYKIDKIKIGEKDGYVVRYLECSDRNCYRAYEYFIEDNSNKFIRFSFFVRDKNFKENMPYIFEAIVKTLKYN